MKSTFNFRHTNRTSFRAKACALFSLILTDLLLVASSLSATPIKVFILAGDENVLENGLVEPGKKAESAAGTLVYGAQ